MLGVFDSGLGGLGVAAAIRSQAPSVDLVVVADQARAPYGDRPAAEVDAWTGQAAAHLVATGCATVVVACNTASTVALDHLRLARPEVAFVGMEPAVKPAVAATRSGVVAVLGTTTTINGHRMASLVARHGGEVRILGIALPGLVDLIEDGLADSPAAEALVAAGLAPAMAEGADTVVLACTHYGFARTAIAKVAGPTSSIIDPAEAVARQAIRVGGGIGSGTTRLLTSGDPVRARRQVALMVGWDLPVARVDLDQVAGFSALASRG